MKSKMRLDKYLSHSGYGTRKDVKKIIKSKRVTINNKVITDSGYLVQDNDFVMIDDELIQYEEYVYYVMNKPSGYVCANKDDYSLCVTDLIDDYHELFTVGRLDKDTTGLLILTNDGVFAHTLTSPKHEITKSYDVYVEKDITEDDCIKCQQRITYEDITYKPCVIDRDVNDTKHCQIHLTEGKYHEVKRIFQSLNNKVVKLHRYQISDYILDLNEGQYRKLTKDELHRLLNKTML